MLKIYAKHWGIGIFLVISVALIQCSSTKKAVLHSPTPSILTGWLTMQQILGQIPETKSEKELYEPDPQSVAKLKTITTDIQIIVILGTWCSDSRREVPRFLKIMEQAQNSHIQYRLLGVDRTKRDAEGLAEKYQIEFVPTFVVLDKNQELGRIVETPTVSIEQDLVDILMNVK